MHAASIIEALLLLSWGETMSLWTLATDGPLIHPPDGA